jgi:hypothetical protein
MTVRRKRADSADAVPLLKKKLNFIQFLKVWNRFKGQRTPKHHLTIAKWLIENREKPEKLLMAFRDGAKSWMICVWIAWCLYDDPTKTFAVISAVDTLATKNAGFIKEIIQSHPDTSHLVPLADSDMWRRNCFNIARPPGMLENSVQALSLGSSMTGQHCDHAFLDDTETPENVETDITRAKLRKRLEDINAICRGTITWIGTPHGGEQSLYVPMLQDPETYVPLVIPVYTEDENGERVYTWPEQFGHEKAARAESKNLTRFRTQYLLEIISSNDAGLPIDLAPTYSEDIIQVKSVDYMGRTSAIKASITIPIEDKPCQFASNCDPLFASNRDPSGTA